MKKYIASIIILILSIALSVIYYPMLPDTMASHWNASGIADGFSGKDSNVLLFPILNAILLVLLFFVPRLDPKYSNILKFEKKFLIFVNSILAFMVLLQLQVFLWNTGTIISMNVLMPIMMGGLFILIGWLLKDAKQNYSIGIRFPWTLNNEVVWNSTHKFGSKLFMASGLLSIISGIFIPAYSFIILIGSILIILPVLATYSYLEFRKKA